MRSSIKSAIAAAFVFGFAIESPAFAQCYAFRGGRWCGVSQGLNVIPINDHTPARWPVSSALSAWNYASPVNQMHLYKVNSGQYVDYWSGRYGADWLGLTVDQGYVNGCFYAGVVVYLDDTDQDAGYGWTNAITRHETGHVLGLVHSSVCETLMWFQLPSCTRSSNITNCDATGVARLYP